MGRVGVVPIPRMIVPSGPVLQTILKIVCPFAVIGKATLAHAGTITNAREIIHSREVGTITDARPVSRKVPVADSWPVAWKVAIAEVRTVADSGTESIVREVGTGSNVGA